MEIKKTDGEAMGISEIYSNSFTKQQTKTIKEGLSLIEEVSKEFIKEVAEKEDGLYRLELDGECGELTVHKKDNELLSIYKVDELDNSELLEKLNKKLLDKALSE